jgi:hypothetical protein
MPSDRLSVVLAAMAAAEPSGSESAIDRVCGAAVSLLSLAGRDLSTAPGHVERGDRAAPETLAAPRSAAALRPAAERREQTGVASAHNRGREPVAMRALMV